MERCVWGQRLLLPCVVCPPPGSAAPSPQGKSRPFLLYPSGGAAPDTGEGARETHRATPPRPRPGHACVHTYTHSRRGCPRPEGGGGGWVGGEASRGCEGSPRPGCERRAPADRGEKATGTGGWGSGQEPLPSEPRCGGVDGRDEKGRLRGEVIWCTACSFPLRFPGEKPAAPLRPARPGGSAASPAPPAPLPGAGAAAPVRSHRMWREAVRCWRLGEAERDGP